MKFKICAAVLVAFGALLAFSPKAEASACTGTVSSPSCTTWQSTASGQAVLYTYSDTVTSGVATFALSLYADIYKWSSATNDLEDSGVDTTTYVLNITKLGQTITTVANGVSIILNVVQNAANSYVGTVTLQNVSLDTTTAYVWHVTNKITSYTGIATLTDTIGQPYGAPLPAALPLFMFGMAGLGGYRRMKKAA